MEKEPVEKLDFEASEPEEDLEPKEVKEESEKSKKESETKGESEAKEESEQEETELKSGDKDEVSKVLELSFKKEEPSLSGSQSEKSGKKSNRGSRKQTGYYSTYRKSKVKSISKKK